MLANRMYVPAAPARAFHAAGARTLAPLKLPFKRNIEDRSWGIGVNLEGDSPRLIMAFSGRGAGVFGIPPFQFLSSLSLISAKKAFVRDVKSVWYHHGVAGVGDDIDSVAGYLRALVDEAGVEQTITIGSSAGGYGALLFGALLSSEVHAFSPQTFIDPELRRIHDDARWPRSIQDLDGRMDPRYADLRTAISASEADCHVYYPTGVRIDVVHAEHLGDLRQVTLHPFESSNHNLVRELRDSGWLESFLNRISAPAGPEA
jgi:pimeloyl-ACP methyl ester carboxylesterase